MVNMIKKPYELSLWDENLTWRRQKLVLLQNLKEEEYQPGVYYSINSNSTTVDQNGAITGTFGARPYVLDMEGWVEGREYYRLMKAQDTEEEYFLEGSRASEINIDPTTDEHWYSFFLTEDEQEIEKKAYYLKTENGYIKASGEFNQQTWYEAKLIPQTLLQYFKEQKIAIIGSNTMDTPIQANNIKLISNVNGSNTLNFSLYSKYWDEEAKQFFDNPFLKLLVNERKIKLRDGAAGDKEAKWYDFIIKNVEENSDTKVFSYTAKDQFVNELSKSGFEIELDPELENNMGNVITLAEKVLDGSDWKVGNNNDLLRQYKEEPLYEIVLKEDLKLKSMLEDKEIVVEKTKVVYSFYSLITGQDSTLQFLYVPEGTYTVDDNFVITNSDIWYLENVTYKNDIPVFADAISISTSYRGKRLVQQALTKYDPTIDKYVSVYSDNENIYYGFTENKYVSPTVVQNFVTQPSEFTSFSGWEAGGKRILNSEGVTETCYPELSLCGYPDMRDIDLADIVDTKFQSFLRFKNTQTGSESNDTQFLFNSGIEDYRSKIDGFTKDEKFVFRIKYTTALKEEGNRPQSLGEYKQVLPVLKIGEYDLKDGVYSIKDCYFEADSETEVEVKDNYVQAILKCNKSVPYSDTIKKRLGILISFLDDAAYYIEDLQFFRYVTYEKEKIDQEGAGTGEYETIMAVPGGELLASARTKYYYYKPNKNYSGLDSVDFVYKDYLPWKEVSVVYNKNSYEKIRSITAKESNRFNLIQTICETFECWPKFNIEHNPNTGEIELDEEDGFRQKKWITFHEYIGKENQSGFKYGINLKNIKRTLNSDGAVSKMVVKNNSNQFAKNGFCSIARAKDNPTGENYLYDFSYYIFSDNFSRIGG